jgi:hypothetical protein
VEASSFDGTFSSKKHSVWLNLTCKHKQMLNLGSACRKASALPAAQAYSSETTVKKAFTCMLSWWLPLVAPTDDVGQI